MVVSRIGSGRSLLNSHREEVVGLWPLLLFVVHRVNIGRATTPVRNGVGLLQAMRLADGSGRLYAPFAYLNICE
jgi:hypothetical protein